MATLAGLVIDGPISRAVVCLDTGNGTTGGAPNGLCDTGEPNALTDANGRYSFQALASDVSRFAVVAVAGTGASDSDRPGEAINFILTAPPGRSTVVSPLTTLVQAYIGNTGMSAADAESAVKTQLGISGSLFADYTTDTSTDGKRAGEVARIVALTKETQTATVQSQIDSGAISRADFERLLAAKLKEQLDAIAAAASPDGTLTLAQAKAAAMSVAADSGITSGNAAGAVAANNAMTTAAIEPVESASAPVGGSRLTWFNFSSPAQYFGRGFTQTAAENTPDSSGMVRFREFRVGAGLASNQSLTRNGYRFFNGTAWQDCPIGSVGTQTVRNTMGIATGVTSCGFGFVTQRSTRAIANANANMSDTVREFRNWPYINQFAPTGTVNYTAWGPDPASTLIAGATFPVGSAIFYQTSTTTTTPNSYDVLNTSFQVRVASENVHLANTAGCAEFNAGGTPATPANTQATTLEQVIARYRGNFCAFTPDLATTGPRNENWSRAALSVGDVPDPSQTGTFYSRNRRILFAFTGTGNGVNYFSCQRRASDGAARNCDLIGSGTYAITTQGDGRVLALSGVPAIAGSLSYNRILVERGGLAFFGTKDKPFAETNIGLNQVAGDALFTSLGLPLTTR